MRTKRQRRGLHTNLLMIQDGEDAQDALSCRSLSTKEPLIVGLFCGKRPMKIRHLMHLRHPVFVRCRLVNLKTSNVYPSHLTYTQKTSTCAYLTFFLQIRTQDDARQSESAHVCMRARVSVHMYTMRNYTCKFVIVYLCCYKPSRLPPHVLSSVPAAIGQRASRSPQYR